MFALGSYTRDVVVAFLPAFLGMVFVFAGTSFRRRLTSAVWALGIVVALWCATPILFSDKRFPLDPAEFLPVTAKHYETRNRIDEVNPKTRRRATSEVGRQPGLSPVLRNIAGELSSSPIAYLSGRYAQAKRFWDPEERWNREISNATVSDSFLTRQVARELERGTTYRAILVVLLSTAVFGLLFSPRWVALAGVFLYVTSFHVLLFPGFTARPKAIFFPFIVLFASAGVFALAEGFVPWLGRMIAARRRRVEHGG